MHRGDILTFGGAMRKQAKQEMAKSASTEVEKVATMITGAAIKLANMKGTAELAAKETARVVAEQAAKWSLLQSLLLPYQ